MKKFIYENRNIIVYGIFSILLYLFFSKVDVFYSYFTILILSVYVYLTFEN